MSTSISGRLFVFEGPNGCGKTVLSQAFAAHLNSREIGSHWLSFPGRALGTLGRHVYEIHRDLMSVGIDAINPVSLQLLHVAAHIDQIESLILPALRQGINVVLDRYWWSTCVYGLSSGVKEQTLHQMLELEALHWEGVVPNTVFLLKCEKPFDEPFTEGWSDLMRAYDSIAASESKKQRVVRICNDGTVADALEKVISSAITNAISSQ